MLYFLINTRLEVLDVRTDYQPRDLQSGGLRWINRNDISSVPSPWMHAQVIAAAATEYSGEQYVATDSSPSCWPRFDVIRAPAVGDVVSKAFNGDCYPVGKIVRATKTLVRTDSGETFRRRRLTGAWVGGGFALIPGTHRELNPSF